ncbi:MAG TPA: hypothetical protein VGA52_05890 [Anaerolineales bacterium]|jgi:transporter family protein
MIDAKNAALLIGGVLPALLYGIAGILQKGSARAGGTVPSYLIAFGLATALVGLIGHWLLAEGTPSGRSVGLAAAAGTLFAVGAGAVSLAILRYDAAISQLSPLYNMNVLVSVVVGLAVFAELKDLNPIRLLGGTALVLLGGYLVSRA